MPNFQINMYANETRHYYKVIERDGNFVIGVFYDNNLNHWFDEKSFIEIWEHELKNRFTLSEFMSWVVFSITNLKGASNAKNPTHDSLTETKIRPVEET